MQFTILEKIKRWDYIHGNPGREFKLHQEKFGWALELIVLQEKL
jgi:hypothetical protein